MPTPGPTALANALLSAFENKSNNTTQAAQAIAEAIDNHIKTCTVTVSGTVTTGAGAGGVVAGTGTI